MSSLYLTTLWTTNVKKKYGLNYDLFWTQLAFRLLFAMTWVSINRYQNMYVCLTLSTHIRWTFSSSVPFSLDMYSLRKWLDPTCILFWSIHLHMPQGKHNPACSQQYILLLYPIFPFCPVPLLLPLSHTEPHTHTLTFKHPTLTCSSQDGQRQEDR